MWTDLYYAYFTENIQFVDVIERIQELGFDIEFRHLNNNAGWIFLMIEEDMGYQDGYGSNFREALLDGLFRLSEYDNLVLDAYRELLQ